MDSSSQDSVIQSTLVCGHQGKIPSVSESSILENPVEMTSAVCTPKDSNYASSTSESSRSLSDSLSRMQNTFSVIIEFLTIPTVAPKKGKGKGEGKTLGGARVLTSEESLTQLLEKEEKKGRGGQAAEEGRARREMSS